MNYTGLPFATPFRPCQPVYTGVPARTPFEVTFECRPHMMEARETVLRELVHEIQRCANDNVLRQAFFYHMSIDDFKNNDFFALLLLCIDYVDALVFGPQADQLNPLDAVKKAVSELCAVYTAQECINDKQLQQFMDQQLADTCNQYLRDGADLIRNIQAYIRQTEPTLGRRGNSAFAGNQQPQGGGRFAGAGGLSSFSLSGDAQRVSGLSLSAGGSEFNNNEGRVGGRRYTQPAARLRETAPVMEPPTRRQPVQPNRREEKPVNNRVSAPGQRPAPQLKTARRPGQPAPAAAAQEEVKLTGYDLLAAEGYDINSLIQTSEEPDFKNVLMDYVLPAVYGYGTHVSFYMRKPKAKFYSHIVRPVEEITDLKYEEHENEMLLRSRSGITREQEVRSAFAKEALIKGVKAQTLEDILSEIERQNAVAEANSAVLPPPTRSVVLTKPINAGTSFDYHSLVTAALENLPEEIQEQFDQELNVFHITAVRFFPWSLLDDSLRTKCRDVVIDTDFDKINELMWQLREGIPLHCWEYLNGIITDYVNQYVVIELGITEGNGKIIDSYMDDLQGLINYLNDNHDVTVLNVFMSCLPPLIAQHVLDVNNDDLKPGIVPLEARDGSKTFYFAEVESVTLLPITSAELAICVPGNGEMQRYGVVLKHNLPELWALIDERYKFKDKRAKAVKFVCSDGGEFQAFHSESMDSYIISEATNP